MKSFPLLLGYIASSMVSDFVKPNVHNLQKIRENIDFELLKRKVLWLPCGEKVGWLDLLEIRHKFEMILDKNMQENQYPTNFLKFDQTLYPVIHEYLSEVTPSLAGRQDFWNFINVGLVPDLVVYRWRKRQSDEINVSDRFFSNLRNYIGSLWWRVYFFYDDEAPDPYHILNVLTEDDFVQIMERPKLRGYENMALALGKQIAKVRRASDDNITITEKNKIIRYFLVDIRIQALGTDFDSYGKDKKNLERVIAESYSRMEKMLLSR